MNLETNLKPITFEDVHQYIPEFLQKYGAVESLSGNEVAFWQVLKQGFFEDARNAEEESVIEEIFTDDKFSYAVCHAVRRDNRAFNPVFVVHLDRVPDRTTGKGYRNTYKESANSTVEAPAYQAQLDNLIGIGVLKYLWDAGRRFNILFTTSEESVQSWWQLKDTVIYYKLTPITVDIDVINNLSDVAPGEISLRMYDQGGPLDTTLVSILRLLSLQAGIPLTESGWSHTETAHLAAMTEGAFKGAHIGLPVTNYHTGSEEVYAKTVYNSIKFIDTLINFTNTTQEE